jgi:beta-lactam-binding protein with PASTA domain
MPMTMLDITFDPVTNRLSITTTATPALLGTGTNTANGNPAPGIADFDPAQPWSVLNKTAFSRRLGWNDPNEGDTSGNAILDKVRAFYGTGACIWIESLGKTQGLDSYLAVGTYGVNSDNSLVVDLSNPTGIPYSGIFGTTASSTKWRWDGIMDHNTYAVPFTYLNGPNQPFTSTYRIYVGDYLGNELLVDKDGNPVASAATTTIWSWQGPAFVFTSQNGVPPSTPVESDVFIVTGISGAQTVSISGGEYAISADNGVTWGDWTSATGTIANNNRVKVRQTSASDPGVTSVATLSIPAIPGPGTFRVSTLNTDTTPDPFTFTSIAGADLGTIYESNAVTVSGINSPAPISITGGEYTVSTDGGAGWSAYSAAAPSTVADGNMVKVRQISSASPNTMTTVLLSIGGVSAEFNVTTLPPLPVAVPDLVGLSQADAQTAITNAGLTVGIITQAYSATVPAGSVISQNPTAGTFAAPGSVVDLVVSSADPVPDPFTFTSMTGVATGFATASNAVTITGISGPAPISISGGNTPYYSVSADNGTTWSSWSATTPATVSSNDQVKVRQTSSAQAFTTTTTTLNVGGTAGSFSVTTGYMNPPSWMPMSMLSVALDSVTGRLSVVDEETKLGTGVYPAMNFVAAGSYDQAKPWSILNGGMAISRQLGWDDPTAAHGNGITPTGQLVIDIANKYGPDAGIWIERISQSSGLETYFADGMWGVGGTGNAASGTPQVYTDANGFPIIYVDNYYGIFGTGGSSSKWRWDGSMIHNVYAVPAAYITQPNQLFTATYRVYVGDNWGNEIMNGDGSSTGTVETWTWKGPLAVPDNVPDQFSFTARTGVALSTQIESNVVTLSGLAVPALISITGGEYTVSTDGGNYWSAWSATAPATIANGSQVRVRLTSSTDYSTTTSAVLTIGGISGPFDVTTVSQPDVAVPNVVGLTQSSAQEAITTAGLTMGVITQAYSATVPAGSVISQNPAAGSSVPPGSAVDLVVSRGNQPVTVPNVVGKPETPARRVITRAGLVVGNVTRAFSTTVAKGSVISQNPAAGTSALPGTAVDLVVSKGKQNHRITGAGIILPERPIFPALFSLNVSSANLKTGHLAFNYLRKRLNLVSTSVPSINEDGNVYTVSGSGKVNGVKGYTFTATVVIGMPDSFGIVIKKANGSVVFSTSTKRVTRGDIRVFK